MIMRTQRGRLKRLEKLIPPYVLQRKKEKQVWLDKLSVVASFHAIRLGALVLRGDPKLDEPLELSWARCLAKFDAVSNVELFRSTVGKEFGDAVCLKRLVLQELPGDSEQQKFQHLFDIAPPWLLKFTRAKNTALVLKLKLPDLSAAPPPGLLGFREGDKWPSLPNGTLQAGQTISELSLLTPEEQTEFIRLSEGPEEEWTRWVGEHCM